MDLEKAPFCHRDAHPVPGKGGYVPCDKQQEEDFEFQPASSMRPRGAKPEKQVPHPGGKQDMAQLMSDQPFCPAMGLHGPGRACLQCHGENDESRS